MCVHHWIIQPPEEAVDRHVLGVCQHCQAERSFSQKVEDVRHKDRGAQLGYPRITKPHTRLPFALADER